MSIQQILTRIIYYTEDSKEGELVCAYFPAKEKEVVKDWYGNETVYEATKAAWFVINGYWDIEFLDNNQYRIVEYPDVVRDYYKYIETYVNVEVFSDPFWYNYGKFCELAEKTVAKLGKYRYLYYKEEIK